jgi:DNA repair photolyase
MDKVNEFDLDNSPDSDLEKVDPYAFFMKSEPHLNKTPIEIDPETGWRFTYRDIAMVRNAPQEMKVEHKVFLDPIPHVVKDQKIPLRGWYKAKHEPPNVRVRPCYTEALLTQPYGGFCAVGCGFCYINHGTRGWRGQGLAVVDPNYGAKVAKQMAGMRTGTAVYMSSFIDPFLELEAHYKNTRRTAEAATANGLPIFFLTRKHVPGWAYDELKKSPYSYMQFSINTSDPQTWRKLSPRAETLEHQIEQVREMRRQGIYVSIQVNPIVAGVVDNDDIVKLIHTLAEAGANHLIFKFVEISYPSVPAMVDQMRKRFGDERAKKFNDLFTCNIGGQRTIDEAYRKAALDIYSVECKKAGVTMALCYEYEFERDSTGEIISSLGKSMGGKYLTADQCHGHRVPMFTRESADQKFVASEVCPPSGCLTCGDQHGGEEKVPCGSKFLGEANALQDTHYKTQFISLDVLRKARG